VSAPYRPGQSQWPGNRQQRPDRPPPIQFRQEDPKPPRNKTIDWGLRILGLVLVAVISGLAWYYINSDGSSSQTSGDDPGDQQSEGVYQFTPHAKMPRAETQYTCPEHAYGDIKTFLENTKCDRLSRQLFVTKVDGRTVYTSVSVVTMADEAAAGELRDLTDKDGSGNVSDVVRDKVVSIEGMDRLSGGEGYASKQSGSDVIIIEADFAPSDKGDDDADQKTLDAVCEDALRLGPEVDAKTG